MLSNNSLRVEIETAVVSVSVTCVYTGADAEVNRQGIEAVKSVLKEARKIARTLPPEKRAAIEEMCNEIEALMQELADLQARGLVSRYVYEH